MTRNTTTPTLTPEQQLRNAAQDGNLAEVGRLIESGADVNLANSRGRTALMAAAWDGHAEVAEKLIQAGANVNLANSDGRTALILAAQEGHTDVADLLRDVKAIEDATLDPLAEDGGIALASLLPRLAEPIVQSRLNRSIATLAAVILADGTQTGNEAVQRINRGQIKRGHPPLNGEKASKLVELRGRIISDLRAGVGGGEETVANAAILALLKPGALAGISEQISSLFLTSKSSPLTEKLPKETEQKILGNLSTPLPPAVMNTVVNFFQEQNQAAVARGAAQAAKKDRLAELSQKYSFGQQRYAPKKAAAAPPPPPPSTSPSSAGTGMDGNRGGKGTWKQ